MSRVHVSDPWPSLPDPVREFHAAYPRWADLFSGDDPVHPLPVPVLEALVPYRGLFPTVDWAAERAFTAHCGGWKMDGHWAGRRVDLGLFPKPLMPLTPELVRELEWTPAEVSEYERIRSQDSELVHRLVGLAGWLVTEPQFVQDRDDLRAAWLALPPAARPSFPLQRAARVLPPGHGGVPTTGPQGVLADRIETFCFRWGLRQLSTWDVPLPQGPQPPVRVPVDRLAVPPVGGVTVFIPDRFPVDNYADLLRLIARRQQNGRGPDELPDGAGPGPQWQRYAAMFRVQHLERAIRARVAGRPRGLTTAIEAAVTAALDLSPDRVRTLRRNIRRCLAGHRDRVRR